MALARWKLNSKIQIRDLAEHEIKFRWLADDCGSWDQVVECLKKKILECQALKERGAFVKEVLDDSVFYTLTGHHVGVDDVHCTVCEPQLLEQEEATQNAH